MTPTSSRQVAWLGTAALRSRYFLDLVEDGRVIADETGFELDCEEDAVDEARRAAAWIEAGYRNGRRPISAAILLRDDTGHVIAQLPVIARRS